MNDEAKWDDSFFSSWGVPCTLNEKFHLCLNNVEISYISFVLDLIVLIVVYPMTSALCHVMRNLFCSVYN